MKVFGGAQFGVDRDASSGDSPQIVDHGNAQRPWTTHVDLLSECDSRDLRLLFSVWGLHPATPHGSAEIRQHRSPNLIN